MTTLTIEIPDKSTITLMDLIDQLGGKVLELKPQDRLIETGYHDKEKSVQYMNEDATSYLSKSEANRKRLQKAVDELKNGHYEEHDLIED